MYEKKQHKEILCNIVIGSYDPDFNRRVNDRWRKSRCSRKSSLKTG